MPSRQSKLIKGETDMDFELTEEMKMLKEMAYKFAVAEITPISQECDEQEKYTAGNSEKKRPKMVWSAHGFRKNMAGPAPVFWAIPLSRKKYPKWIWVSA